MWHQGSSDQQTRSKSSKFTQFCVIVKDVQSIYHNIWSVSQLSVYLENTTKGYKYINQFVIKW